MKKIIAVILAALTALCFAGCKKKEKRTLYNYDMQKYVSLGKYKGIEIDKSSDTYANYENSYFKSDVSNNDLFNKRTDGVVADGDITNISYSGKIKSSGKIFTGDTSADDNDGFEDYNLTIGSKQFIDGFEDQLVGVKVGDTKVFDITFPEDYGNDELNGALTTFTVKVNYVNEYPEKDNEFAQKLGFYSLQAYNDDLQGRIVKTMALDSIMNSADFAVKSYPETEKANYDKLFNSYVSYAEQQAQAYSQQYGQTVDADVMLQSIYGISKSQLQEYYNNALKKEMIMYAIYDKEKLSYTDEEYEESISELAKSSGKSEDDIKKNYDEWTLEANAVTNCVTEFIKDNAIVK